MQIGERVRRVPTVYGVDAAGRVEVGKAQSGTITYIHPEGRFYVVTFADGIRESFYDLNKRADGTYKHNDPEKADMRGIKKDGKKYTVELCHNYKRAYLGRFTDLGAAKRARDAYERKHGLSV